MMDLADGQRTVFLHQAAQRSEPILQRLQQLFAVAVVRQTVSDLVRVGPGRPQPGRYRCLVQGQVIDGITGREHRHGDPVPGPLLDVAKKPVLSKSAEVGSHDKSISEGSAADIDRLVEHGQGIAAPRSMVLGNRPVDPLPLEQPANPVPMPAAAAMRGVRRHIPYKPPRPAAGRCYERALSRGSPSLRTPVMQA